MHFELGQILRKLRKEQHLKQQEVANFLFISRPTYIRYEKDEVEMPLSKLFELSSLYGCDISDLVKLIDEMIPRDHLNHIIQEPKIMVDLDSQTIKSCA